MNPSARENYLETEVLTATPQKLQLMLIDAAIRSAERARQQWKEGADDHACESLIRAQEIVSEILGGLNQEEAPELSRKLASVYLFIFRSLMEANYRHDKQKLDDALRVLHVERETWRQVCEKNDVKAETPDVANLSSEQATPAPLPLVNMSPDDSPATGLSLEA